MAEPADKSDVAAILKATDDDTDRITQDLRDHHTNIMDRFFSVGRDTQDLRAQVTGLGYQVRDGFTAAAKDSEINALKTQLDASKNTQSILDRVTAEGDRTRDYIRANNDAMLNRNLIERNTELVAALDDGRFWRGRYDGAQWQSLNSQLQAFQSQLQETRQGMVNFGTMAGVGQSSTSNNVR